MAHIPEDLEVSFEILQEIGSGSFGRVIRARDRALGRIVALKLARSRDPEGNARFLREARTMSRVAHPHVLRVFDFGVADGFAYLVTEHLEGHTLEHEDRPPQALDWMLEVAEALEAVHEEGLIHRDLKPANVMRTVDHRTVLLDFGLAYDPDRTRMTREGYAVGTPVYMAPELLEGATATPASDWYSWGVLLYRLLEGTEPYDGREVLDAARRGRWPAVRFSTLAPGDPRRRVVERCLAPRPAERPAGLPEIRRLLEVRDESGSGASSRSTLVTSPLSEDRPASGRLSLGMAALAWLGVLGIGGALLLSSRSTPSPPPPSAPSPSSRPPSPEAPPRWEVPPDLILLGRNQAGFEEYRNPWDESVMVRIPGTTFVSRAARTEGAGPRREVSLAPFLISKHEIQRHQFTRFMDETGFPPPNFWDLLRSETRYPVMLVDWDGARDYCRWAHGRLPTVEEWELAAGGTDGRRFPWGDSPPTPERAQYAPADGGARMVAPPFSDLRPVGSFPAGASPFGVLDMAGNVSEWTSSVPPPEETPRGTPPERLRLAVGGSWISSPEFLTVRRYLAITRDTADHTVGIRLVRSLERSPPAASR